MGNAGEGRGCGRRIGRWAGLALLLAAAAPAAAQEPLTMRVKPLPTPSESEISAEARARQERLLRRMREADYLFRNICRNCGGSIEGPGAYDPVDPPSRLGGHRPPPAQAPAVVGDPAEAPPPAPE
jgi:hypothetical protein